jgi:uncharacterized protein (DUF2235 family)
MSKNIVILSDGTGQEGGKKYNTNIYKLFNMLEDRTSRQVVFYDPGLGTGWRKISGNVGGMGMSRNIRQCYTFIFEHFEAGDRIFLFGFSRGSATVRSLSSFIHDFGILPKSRPELIKRAYKIYKKSNENKRKLRAEEFVGKHHTMWTRIKFLGCYDTVAALGLPFKTASAILDGIPGFRHKFHDFTLSESVENAYQAIAIDDERKTFHPILWDTETSNGQTIRQVWFAGMHTDVGGGYQKHNLSDIPLVWMTQMAVSKGLLIYPHHEVEIAEDANGHMHNSRGSLIAKLYRRKVRFWPSNREDKPVVHQSVLERTKNRKNQDEPPYHPWILDLDYDKEPWMHYKDQSWYTGSG